VNALEKLGLSIKQLQNRHHRALDVGLAPLGVTLVQWHAMREISQNQGRPQLRIAEATFNSAQALGTLVTRLERANLVFRAPLGGRALTLSLTAKGEELLEQGRAIVLEVLAESFGGLSKTERIDLQRLISKALSYNDTAKY
jgi:DNA-binding MarR family transcriptional regulator